MSNQDYLTDQEKTKIETFCKDEVLYEAVKKVLLQHIYSQGVLEKGVKHNPLKNRAFALAQHATENPMTDEILGQHVRGLWEGVNALESGYNDLRTIKSMSAEIKRKIINEAE